LRGDLCAVAAVVLGGAPQEIADSEPDLVLVGVGADEERPLALIDALAAGCRRPRS